MHHRIDNTLTRIRQDIARHLEPESILQACRSANHTWRACVLTPVAIVHWFLIQILCGNAALAHISLLGGRTFSDTAYCLARARLPLAVFQILLRNLVASLVPQAQSGGLWRGHRTLLIDGSSFSMPDTATLQAEFGQPGNQAPGCGFPVAKILAMFDAATGLLLEVIAAPMRTHDIARCGAIHAGLKPGDVLVGDRGFCSFAHLAMLAKRGVFAVLRVHQRQIIDFTPGRPHCVSGKNAAKTGMPRSRWLRSLGNLDQMVEYFKPDERPEWMSEEDYAALPKTLIVRELRYEVGRPGFRTRTVTLVTTLLEEELYPLESLAELYGMRWQVELNLRHLKTTMKLEVLKCMTVEGVLKELTVYAIVYNLVHVVMIEASHRQGVEVDRISFVDALRWLAKARPGEDLPKLKVNPSRPNRVEPRAKKRRPKQYDLMNKPRHVLRKGLLSQQVKP